MGDLTQVMAHIAALAGEYLDYPLHIVVESADGDSVVYFVPAKGAAATCMRIQLTDRPFPQFPVFFVVRERDMATDPDAPAIIVEIPKKKPGNVIKMRKDIK